MPRSIYIAHIECSVLVSGKINSKHGITEQDVRDAIQWPARPLRAFWVGLQDDPRGPRAVAIGQIPDGRVIKAVLYPVEDQFAGTWRLGTAVVET